VGKRAVCLLLSADQESARSIKRATGLSPDAITDVRRRWRERGLSSLIDRPRKGRPPRVTAEYLRQLRRALRRGPRAYGYVFTVWSIARLVTHLHRQTGVKISRDWLRRLAHKADFVIGRPKHTLKGKRDPREYQQAAERLSRLKRGPRQQTRRSSCGTRTRPSSNSCRTWCAAGCPEADRWK